MTTAGLIPPLVLSTSRQEAAELGGGEQAQQALQLASMGGGGVELEGKSASIKSISDSIQSSNACSFSSCSISLLSRLRSICRSISLSSSSLSRLSLSGSRRQLRIDKNERKGESDEPDAPLLLHGDEASEEVYVVIGGEQRNESNHKASDSLKHGWRIDREATRLGLHWRTGDQSRSPKRQSKTVVRAYQSRQVDRAHVSPRSATPPATPTRRP